MHLGTSVGTRRLALEVDNIPAQMDKKGLKVPWKCLQGKFVPKQAVKISNLGCFFAAHLTGTKQKFNTNFEGTKKLG